MNKSKYALNELVAAADALINESPDAVHMFINRLSACFNEDGKMLVAGLGENASIANVISMRFQHRTSIDRPALPAISMNQNPDLSGVSREKQFWTRQLQLHADAGDFFLLLADTDDEQPATMLLEMAKEAGCTTAILFPGEPDALDTEADFFFYLPAQSPNRRIELSLFFGQHLCELVEEEIFGF